MQRLQRETTSTEFLELVVFYDEHWPQMFDPLHHYLAQIAWAVFKSQSDKSWTGKIGDFLLKFVTEGQAQKSPMTKEEATAAAGITWMQRLGMIGRK